MAKKSLMNLTKEFEFQEEREFLMYIVKCHETGQKKLAKNLFKRIKHPDDVYAGAFIKQWGVTV